MVNNAKVLENKKKTKIIIVLAMAFFSIGILAYFLPSIKADMSNLKERSSIQECIEKELETIVTKLSLQGGSLYPENYILYQGQKTEYLCHTEKYYKTCIVQQPKLKSHIESEIRNEIGNKIKACYENKGYEINLDQGEVNVGLVPEKIITSFNYSKTSVENSSETHDSFKIVLDNDLYELVSIVNSILNWEARYGDAETTIYMNYYHDLKIEKKKQSEGSTIYILTDRNTGNKFQFASKSVSWPPGYGISFFANEEEKKSQSVSLGTCFDNQEGTCIESTTLEICENAGGIWKQGKADEIQECKLGCCLIGDQAAFVTQARCWKLSALYGFKWSSWVNMENEAQCVASSYDLKGACVVADTCENTIESKCNIGNGEFYEGYLCSAEELATGCKPTNETICSEDKIYFIDSCGNLANIYDSSKVNNKDYWSKTISTEESCGYGLSNVNSKSCGNCDYFLGSSCKSSDEWADKSKPDYGDYICEDLSCEYEGKVYSHGETWCASSRDGESLPGTRDFRLLCYNNEVLVEPCADYRQENCIEYEIQGFKTANCKVNRWQDCILQASQKVCENSDIRDCQWIQNTCMPRNTPGFNFWHTNGDAESLCSLANKQCIIKYGFNTNGEKVCVENCECLEDSWTEKNNQLCIALGDCRGEVKLI